MGHTDRFGELADQISLIPNFKPDETTGSQFIRSAITNLQEKIGAYLQVTPFARYVGKNLTRCLVSV